MAALAALLLAGAGARAQNAFPPQPVGATSGEQSVQVTSPGGGTVSSVEVLTLGQAGRDFAAGAGASTCPSDSLSPGGTCAEWVTFTPSAPGLRMGAVVLLDSGGKVLGTAYIYGTGSGGLGVLTPGNLVPVAGQLGLYTTVDDGKPATQAQLYLPTGVAVDSAGNLYIADSQHNRIRMVCVPSATPTIHGTSCSSGAGIISTIAGDGDPTDTGDGGAAADATLNAPNGVALDGAGNLYIADTGNNVIRMISAATGVITTVAGNAGGSVCTNPVTDDVGDGCPATQATLNQPWGVTLGGSGNLYIADTYDHRIREVSTASGIVSTIAGNGYMAPNGSGGYNGDGMVATGAELNFPYAVAFDAEGNMYIPDSGNDRVREVMAVDGSITPASTIATFAGDGNAGYAGDGAAANQAELWSPSGVAVDAAGNVYIADTQNAAIRKVSAATGFISTVVENGRSSYYYGNQFIKTALYGPIGLYLDGNGDMYVADSLNMVVRKLQSNFAALDYLATPVRQGSQSTPIDQTVENDGNAPLDLTALTAGVNTVLAPSTTCATGTPYMGVNGDCTIATVFAPTTSGDPLTGDIDVAEDTQPGPPEVTAPNSPLDIKLVGNATAVNSTTTTIASDPDPSGYGQSVAFTVTMTTGAGTGNLTGTVSLADTFNGVTTTLAPGLTLTLNTAGDVGTVTFKTAALAVGQHSIVASYNNANDPGHFPSTSIDNSVPPLIQTVLEGTKTTLQSSANPSAVGQNVVFTATVAIGSAGGGGAPDGTVTFMDGTNVLGTQTLTVSGSSATATYATNALTNGVHQITAVYSGDSSNQISASTSTVLSQDVQASSSIGVTSDIDPSNYGIQVTFTATVTSTAAQAATGTVTFLDNGKSIGTGILSGNPATASLQISSLTVGNHPITVSYPGDSYNAASTSLTPYVQTVNQTQTSTTVSASPSPGVAGAPETITAAVHVIAGSATTTGTVTFTSGTTVLGSANLNTATETATIAPTLVPGTYEIVATYAGDANDEGSASSPPFALVVNQAATQTTVSAAPNPAQVLTPVTFTAEVTGNGGTPTGAVGFLVNGSVVDSATLNAGTATFTTSTLAAGTYTVAADYLGDTNDLASSGTGTSQLVVGTIPTETDLGSSTTSGPNPQVVLVATVLNGVTGPMPTGTVAFNSGTTLLGTATVDASGVATLTPSLTPGDNYTITATYSGDADHGSSTSQPIAVSGTVIGFGLKVTPSAVTVAAKQNITVTVNLSSYGGFADSVGLGCASLPAGVNCHFSSPSVNLSADGTASAQLTIDTNNPLSGGASAMNRPAGGGGVSLASLFLPLSVFFGWLFGRLRRRNASIFTMLLALALSVGTLLATGCNGISMGSAAPGDYVIQVTGTGTNSGAIHYQNVSLTITP